MFLFCSLSAFAYVRHPDFQTEFTGKTFNFPFQKPIVDNTHLYFEVVLKKLEANTDNISHYYPFVFSVFFFPSTPNGYNASWYPNYDLLSHSCLIDVDEHNTSGNFFTLRFNNFSSSALNLFISYCDSSCIVQTEQHSVFPSDSYNFSFVPNVFNNFSGYELVSARCYGNASLVSNAESFDNFTFNYGSEANTFNLLTAIYESIQNLSIASGTSSPAFDSSVLVSLSESLSNIENLLSEQNPDISDISSDVANIKSYLNTLKSTVSTISTNLNTVKNTTTTINTHLFACKNNLDTLLTNINSLYTRLGNVLDELRSLGADVEDILEWMDSFYTQFQRIRNQLTEIDQKLYEILEVLRGNPAVTVTGPDTSKMDEYYNVENSLLNNPDVNPSEALKIEYNQNAFSFIWQEVTRAISNPKVFGTVLTVLSLGLVCLIFGRKV